MTPHLGKGSLSGKYTIAAIIASCSFHIFTGTISFLLPCSRILNLVLFRISAIAIFFLARNTSVLLTAVERPSVTCQLHSLDAESHVVQGRPLRNAKL